MKKLFLMLLMVIACAVDANAQGGFLGRLKDRAKNAAENAVTMKAERKVDAEVSNAMDDVLDGKKSSQSKKSKNNDEENAEEVEEEPQEEEATYVQSDFVPGAVAFFEDNLQGEQMGEFPSKWDLIEGSTDVAVIKGKKCIHFEPGTRIEPLMTNQESYIPDVFTLEFDFWMNDPKTEMSNCYELEFKDGNGDDVYEIRIGES